MPIENLTETAEETAQFEAMLNEQAPPEPKQPEPTPQPEPEPKPEPAAEPAKAAEPPKETEKPVRLVPHQALHEEREKRKQLEQRLAALEKEQQPAPPAGDQEPDETTDPIGTIAWLKAQRAKEQAERAEAQRQQDYLQDLGRKVQTRVDAYAAEHPEYKEQVHFLREFRFRQLMDLGVYTPQAAAQQIQAEEIALGKMAVDYDLDPGEIVSKQAALAGWKPKEPEAPAKPETPTPAPAPEAAAKIERLAKGQAAAVSSSGAGGGGPAAEMTLERLLELDGAAFDEAFKKHGPRLMQ